jgi:very-short-patch-repair endonuclease
MRDSERKSIKHAKTLRQRMTDAEIILWSRLRMRAEGGVRFRR